MTFTSTIFTTLVASAALFAAANAERHTVTFENHCGRGTPLLKVNGQTISTGGAFTTNAPLTGAIGFLQIGNCGDNGEGCTLIETTLKNPTSPGGGSSTDISLIPPHAFSVASGFRYSGAGCDGIGADCTSPDCDTAFHNPDDTGVQRACQGNDVNLVITFCE